MASRIAARFATRRLYSSGGKMLGEEEKAAENVYIKKAEQEKLEKLARKGVKTVEQPPPATPAATATEVKPSEAPGSSTKGVSTDKNRNYAVLAGTVTVLAGFGWYYLSKPKKTEETAD